MSKLVESIGYYYYDVIIILMSHDLSQPIINPQIERDAQHSEGPHSGVRTLKIFG